MALPFYTSLSTCYPCPGIEPFENYLSEEHVWEIVTKQIDLEKNHGFSWYSIFPFYPNLCAHFTFEKFEYWFKNIVEKNNFKIYAKIHGFPPTYIIGPNYEITNQFYSESFLENASWSNPFYSIFSQSPLTLNDLQEERSPGNIFPD